MHARMHIRTYAHTHTHTHSHTHTNLLATYIKNVYMYAIHTAVVPATATPPAACSCFSWKQKHNLQQDTDQTRMTVSQRQYLYSTLPYIYHSCTLGACLNKNIKCSCHSINIVMWLWLLGPSLSFCASVQYCKPREIQRETIFWSVL